MFSLMNPSSRYPCVLSPLSGMIAPCSGSLGVFVSGILVKSFILFFWLHPPTYTGIFN